VTQGPTSDDHNDPAEGVAADHDPADMAVSLDDPGPFGLDPSANLEVLLDDPGPFGLEESQRGARPSDNPDDPGAFGLDEVG
jgi:hypothetical protein